jgi:uncharacterized small protein (DUF1192 family)
MEQRLSYLEQLIIIIIVTGGWRPPGHGPGPIPDPFAVDTPRLEALLRALPGRHPPGDSFASDITRLSVTEIEGRVHEVAAAITRLQAQQGELQARLRELRAGHAEGSERAPRT